MDYYIISAELAERLNLTKFRNGNKEKGYLVNSSDLSTIGVATAIQLGAKYTSSWEANKFIEDLNNQK